MDFRKREALRKTRIFLLENVIFDVLLDHLIEQGIFSDTMLDYIKAGQDRTERIRRLLDELRKRPDSCYARFLTALSNSGHEHCTEEIERNYVQSGPTQVSEPTPSYTYVTPTACPGLPDDDVPMANALPQDTSPLPPAASTVVMGFPEMSNDSMQGYAGSFSSPVQESSEGSLAPNSAIIQQMNYQTSCVSQVPGLSATVPLSVYQQQMSTNPQAVYPMESMPRGLALVINNENFTHLDRRTGSKRDLENLFLLFKKLGYNVCHQTDKTAEEMREVFRSFTKYEPLERVDSLVVVVLSHGGRAGIVFGRDGRHKGGAQDYVTDEEIRDMFSARHCPLMANKPKLIIIQACRGVNEDAADSTHPSTPNTTNTAPNTGGRGGVLGQDGGSVTSTASTASSVRVANMADICLIHSTVHGYVSYRHPVEGSPFIQEMTRVFQDMAHKEHLTDMMTQVNRKLANRQLQEDLRQVASTTNTLTKKWFFNPPHP